MSDFVDVTKYLDKFPVRVASYQEALNANIPFDKFYGKVATRAIKKIFWYIQLQPYQVIGSLSGRLIFQYNITMPVPFYILGVVNAPPFYKPGISTTGMQAVGAVKWRKGTDVSRYCIINKEWKGPLTFFINHQNKVSFVPSMPDYGNQVIPANFCIEFWTSFLDIAASGQLGKQSGFATPILIQTSIMSDPLTADDAAVIVQAVNPISVPIDTHTLGVGLPEPLPYTQDDIVWLDNP